MKHTLKELMERLTDRCDPDDLLEMLDLSSEEIIEAFPDKIRERKFQLEQEYFDDEEQEPDDYHSGE